MDKNLVAAVAEKNLSHIKSALTAINLKDRNFSTGEFEEALRYVEGRGINLYVPFDGGEFKPESQWDNDYWLYVNVTLEDNFCRERIDLLKKIGRKLYPVKAQASTPPPQKPTTSTTTPRNENSGIPKPPRQQKSEGDGVPLPLKVVGTMAAIGLGCVTIGPPATLGIAAAGGAIVWLTNKH